MIRIKANVKAKMVLGEFLVNFAENTDLEQHPIIVKIASKGLLAPHTHNFLN